MTLVASPLGLDSLLTAELLRDTSIDQGCQLTSTMKGVFFSHDLPGLCEIRDFEIWKPAPDEILIKNVAVASNPKDWKVPLTIKERSAIEGNDIAGYVEEVGSGVSGFEKGDKVAAFTKMRSESKYGAYAEYSVSPANTVWHVAESTSFEDVVTLPLAVMTACMSLYKVLKLELPPSSGEQGSASGVLLINGASTTIGIYGVQLAKRSGYKVIGIAGASSDLAMSYGFDAVIDYRDKSASEIAKAVKTAIEQFGSLVGVFDAVSEKSTIEMIAYEILQPEGGNIVTVLPPYEDGGLKVDNVSLVRNQVSLLKSARCGHALTSIGIRAGWMVARSIC